MNLTHSEKALLIKALETFEKEKVRIIEVDEYGDETGTDSFEDNFRNLSPGQSVDLKNLTKKIKAVKSVAPID